MMTKLSVVTFVAMILLAGCQSDLCPAVACSPSLSISFEGNVPDRYEVTLAAPDMTTMRFVCANEVFEEGSYEALDNVSSPMDEGIVRCTTQGAEVSLSSTPASLQIILKTENGSIDSSATPVWTAKSPETECISTCRHAELTLKLP
jgi:hypothetical protein